MKVSKIPDNEKKYYWNVDLSVKWICFYFNWSIKITLCFSFLNNLRLNFSQRQVLIIFIFIFFYFFINYSTSILYRLCSDKNSTAIIWHHLKIFIYRGIKYLLLHIKTYIFFLNFFIVEHFFINVLK